MGRGEGAYAHQGLAPNHPASSVQRLLLHFLRKCLHQNKKRDRRKHTLKVCDIVWYSNDELLELDRNSQQPTLKIVKSCIHRLRHGI